MLAGIVRHIIHVFMAKLSRKSSERGGKLVSWRGVPQTDIESLVPNGVSGPETNPLRDRAVLLLRLGELLLRPERLVALWWVE